MPKADLAEVLQPNAAAARAWKRSRLAPQPVPAETLRVGVSIRPDTLEPSLVTNTAVASLLGHVVETLVTIDANGKVAPQLAKSWKVSPDGREFTFQLPQGVTFHDGTPLDAKAVVWNAQRLAARAVAISACPVAAELAALQRTEAIDATTVRYTLSRPVPNFLANLSWVAWSILSPQSEKVAPNQRFNIQHPVGTGPFTFDALTGDQLQLSRFDGYRGERPHFSKLAFQLTSNPRDTEALLSRNQIDVVFQPGAKPQLRSVAASARFSVQTTPGLRSVFVNLHNQKPPFNDLRVRQAVNLAIDKRALIDELLQGDAKVMDAPVAPGLFGYCPVGSYNYDPAKAKALLAKAKVAPGTPLKMLSPRGRYLADEAVAQRIGGYLRDVGFEVTVQALEWPALMGEISRPPQQVTADMYLFGWAPTFPDAGWQLPHLYASKNWPPFGPAGSFYKNPEVDTLLEAASREAKPSARGDLFCEAEMKIWADAPAIFLWVQNYHVATREGLTNVVSTNNERFSVAFAKPASPGATKPPRPPVITLTPGFKR
ncbi:MAG: ABC transporter substrate-binding protein [Thermoanaerobaculia bacterium]